MEDSPQRIETCKLHVRLIVLTTGMQLYIYSYNVLVHVVSVSMYCKLHTGVCTCMCAPACRERQSKRRMETWCREMTEQLSGFHVL